MALSVELVSQFAKVVKDDSPVSTESVCYGTIVEYDGIKYVQLDGSDILTPFASTTNVADGERVTVMIKDHSLIVTGNTSSPAARTDEVEEIGNKVQQSVSTVDVQYYLSSSNAELLDGEWSTVAPEWEQGKYMWSRVVTTLGTGVQIESEPTCIAGAKGDPGSGISIVSITNYYLVSAFPIGVTIDSEGWTTTVQEISADNKYLWNYEVTLFTDGTSDATTPCVIGAYGDTGDTGVGVQSIKEKYAISESSDEEPTEWYDSVQVMSSTNKYLWNYEIITYTTGTSVETNKRIIGAYGDNGDPGNGIINVSEEYYASTSKTELLDGEWSVTAPTWSSGMYIWYRSKIEYSNGITEYTNPYCDSSWEVVTELEGELNDVKDTANGNSMRISDAQLVIDKLNNVISSLVTGQNGESLMTQTEDGWTFSIKNVLDTLNAATTGISDIETKINETENSISTLEQTVSDLGEYTEYIKFGTSGGQPCIILGETDSAFKLMITNTDIRFMDGTTMPAVITNQALNISRAIINEELVQGGFAWIARDNGNLGLLWKGE